MSLENVKVSFIGQKISKLCWSVNRDGSTNSNEFLSGSWDDKINFVSRWKIPDESIEDGDNVEPYMISKISQNGSVTDFAFINPETLACSTSCGDVSVISFTDITGNMEQLHCWSNLHQYEATKEPASCCCLAVHEQEIVTGGEDGRINLLHIDRKKPLQVLENADNSNITGLEFLSSKELAFINTTGQLKLWDTRSGNGRTAKTLTLSGNTCPLLCLDKHPNQPHILVTGHGDGVIGIWDARQDKAPITLIDAHEGEVWQVRFHPMYPDNLFTCSEDGSCWFWDGTTMISGANFTKTMNETSNMLSLSTHEVLSSSIWLYVDANKHKMETFSLIPSNKTPINSFDVSGSSLICGTDGESIILVNDIPVR